MRSPLNVRHFKCLLERNKTEVERGSELKNGAIKSAAYASFAVFDGAEKEMFWIDNPCLW